MTEIDTWQTPFLQGLMAPVFDERDDRDLEVVGEIPAGLRGMFVRTGPNPQFAPLGAYHPFDGDGMLHAVYLEDGKARYRNRFVESKGLLAERARGHACYGGMSNFQFPDPDVMEEGGMMKNTANTATVRHAGRYFTLLESGAPTEFDRDLNTLGEHDYDTERPEIDVADGERLNGSGRGTAAWVAAAAPSRSRRCPWPAAPRRRLPRRIGSTRPVLGTSACRSCCSGCRPGDVARR